MYRVLQLSKVSDCQVIWSCVDTLQIAFGTIEPHHWLATDMACSSTMEVGTAEKILTPASGGRPNMEAISLVDIPASLSRSLSRSFNNDWLTRRLLLKGESLTICALNCSLTAANASVGARVARWGLTCFIALKASSMLRRGEYWLWYSFSNIFSNLTLIFFTHSWHKFNGRGPTFRDGDSQPLSIAT